MSERNVPERDADATNAVLSIGQRAEWERWQRSRHATRRRLRSAVTAAFLYLMAALAVGAYLIVVVKEVSRGTVITSNWTYEQIDFSWMTQVAWGYGALAALAIVAYPLLLLLIDGRLPALLARLMRWIPGIGSTMQMVALGEFCESMYQSVARSKTYGEALAQASNSVRDSAMRQWSARASQQVAAGQSFARVLRTSPIHDQPLPALHAWVQNDITWVEALRVWHRAAAQCHVQSQRRLNRTVQAISLSCLLACVFLAAFGMLIAATTTSMALEGWLSVGLWGQNIPSIFSMIVESQLTMIPVAIGSLLLACTFHSIGANFNEHPAIRTGRIAIKFVKATEWFLWTLGLLALIVAVPHPITVVLAAMFVASIVIAGRWRYHEETQSLNDWLRLAVETTVSIPVLVERMADGFRSRLAGQSRVFAVRVNRGQGIVDAARRTGLPIEADTLAAIMAPPHDVAPEVPRRFPGAVDSRSGGIGGQREPSAVPPIVTEQFVYVVVTLFLAWVISIQVRAVILPVFTQMLDEYSLSYRRVTQGLDITVTIGNGVTLMVAIWLVAAWFIRWLPLSMVRWVPWFGQRSIDRWRCEVLRAIAGGVRNDQPAGDIFQFAQASTRVRWIRRRCAAARRSIEKGTGLVSSLRIAKLVSVREQTWLSSAEKNGGLADTLDQIVGNIHRRQTLLWDLRKAWLVPLATVGVGIYVLIHCLVVFRVLSLLIGGRA